MSFEILQERLAALQETISKLKQLIDRLANIEFQPGSVPLGTDEEDSVSGELSAEIGQMLRSGIEDQELLTEEVKYLRPEGSEKEMLKDVAERAGRELTSCRFAFRKARIAAKKSLDKSQKLEKELMLQTFSATPIEEPIPEEHDGNDQSKSTPQLQQRETYRPPRIAQANAKSRLSEEDQQTVGASSNVTDALRRTHDLMAAELSRSEFAHQTLVESSAALKQLDQAYGSLDSMLASSKDLLGTLLRSQKSDTWYLQTSMYMLMVTLAWLVFRRWLYGPAWWLVWLPLRLVFRVFSGGGGKPEVEVVTTTTKAIVEEIVTTATEVVEEVVKATTDVIEEVVKATVEAISEGVGAEGSEL